MKSKHVFIQESDVHPTLRVHILWVGTSEREQRQRDRIVMAKATDKDIFFAQWSCEVCDFIDRLAEQIYDTMSPRDAWAKFHERNVVKSSLSEVLQIIQSTSNPSNVKNLKSQRYDDRQNATRRAV